MIKLLNVSNASFFGPNILKNDNRFETEISIFTSVALLTTLSLFHMSRAGFESYFFEIHQIAGLGLFIFCFPAFYIKAKKLTNTIGLSALLTLAAFLSLILISFLPKIISVTLFSLIIYSGYLFFIFQCILFLYTKSLLYVISLFFFSTLIGLWLFGRVYSSYHSPLAFENFMIGKISRDTIFHSAILEMIKTYSIPSTGLNDTPYLPYHYGSHWLLAKVSILLDINSTKAYNLLYPCLFIPLFFKSFLIFSKDLFDLRNKNSANYKIGITFWLAFMLLIVGFLPYGFTRKWALFEAWIESESHLIGLLYFFLLSSLIIRSFTIISDKKIYAFYTFTICLILPLIGFLKISLLVILLAACGYLFLRLRLYKNWIASLAITITIIFSYQIFKATNFVSDSENDNFYLFHFIKTYTLVGWQGFFYYIHYFFTFFYIYMRLKSLNVTFGNLKRLILKRKLLDVEILIIISILGLIPASVLRIDGGSAGYFTDIQIRISIALILFFVLEDNLHANKFSTLLNRILLFLPLLIIFSLNNIFVKLEAAVNDNLNSRIRMAASYQNTRDSVEFVKGASPNIILYTAGKFSDLNKKLDELIHIPFKGLETTYSYKLFNRLDSLNSLPKQTKAQSYIFIPKDNYLWGRFNSQPLSAFTIPALTGIRGIDALPTNLDLKLYRTFGFPTYRQYYYRANQDFYRYKLDLDSARRSIDTLDLTLLKVKEEGVDTLKYLQQ